MPSIVSADSSSSDDEIELEDGGAAVEKQRDHPDEVLTFDDDHSNVIWTGPSKKTPLVIFRPEHIVNKDHGVRQVGEKYHLSYILTRGDCKIVRTILHAHGFHESHAHSSDFNLMWTSSQVKPYVLRGLTEFQRINHFPRSYELTRKDRLFKNVQRMQQIKGTKHFDIVPVSYVIPSEFQDFCSAFLKDKGPYIVKPIALSRGRGIYLCTHPDQIQLDEQLIVCKYVSNPFLIDGFKFDIRLYVAVTSYDPLVIYLYEEGLTRFATMKYEANLKNVKQQCMHLTNYSINKRNQNFVHNDDANVEDYGNKWSLGALLRYLRSIGKDVAALMLRIEDVVIKAIISVEQPIATACRMFQPFRGNCFELYGFDIILDEALRPWLLEVNLSPSLACDAPLDFKVKSHMICDLLSLVGMPCQDPMLRVLHQNQNRQRNPRTGSASSAGRPGSGPHAMGPTARPPAGAKPQSASKRLQGAAGMVLTADETKMIRRIREEHARKGGWTRIFPTKDTWDIYSSFFQSSSSYNYLLHMKLFGEGTPVNPKTAGAAANSTTVISKTKVPMHSLSSSMLALSLSSTSEHHRRVASAFNSVEDRLRFYERRLGTPPPPPRQRKRSVRRQPPQAAAVMDPSRGVFRGNIVHPGDPSPPPSSSSSSSAVVSVASDSETEEPPPPPPPPPPPRAQADQDEESCAAASSPQPEGPSPADFVSRGGEMTKLQARNAFGSYLFQVQHRLLRESQLTRRPSAEESRQAAEQIDLVLRFLRRASQNLHREFRVQIPSRKLPLAQRKRILAQMLGEFIAIYGKETEHMRIQLKGAEPAKTITDDDFSYFLRTASELELEAILTTYTHANKSAGIFINANRPASTNLVRSTSMDSGVSFRDEMGAEDSTAPPEPSVSHAVHGLSAAQQSMKAATLAYSKKLSRPSSALTLRSASSSTSASASRAHHRPSSAQFSRQQRIPVVETYDEAAINEALQKLALKQQARQYSASTVGSVLKDVRAAYHPKNYEDARPEGKPPAPRRSNARIDAELAERLRQELAGHRPRSRSRELASNLLQQFRQSKALLEQSRAKHDAMLAQVGGEEPPAKLRPKPPAGPKPQGGASHGRSAVVRMSTGLQQNPAVLKMTFASSLNANRF